MATKSILKNVMIKDRRSARRLVSALENASGKSEKKVTISHTYSEMGRKEYTAAVEQAKANYTNLQERGDAAVGEDAVAFLHSLLTPEEIAESKLRVNLMGEIVKARQEKGISQKKLEELSGVKQPVIARMERGQTSPQIDTILKVLAPLGKTLAIVPLDTVE